MRFFIPWTLLKHAVASLIIAFLGSCMSKYIYPRHQASSIGIIGGADGPTAIYVSGKLFSYNWVFLAILIVSLLLYVPVSKWLR